MVMAAWAVVITAGKPFAPVNCQKVVDGKANQRPRGVLL